MFYFYFLLLLFFWFCYCFTELDLILSLLYHNATIRSHFITYCRTRVGYLEYLINRWVRLFIAKNSGYLLILMSNVSRAVLEINGH